VNASAPIDIPHECDALSDEIDARHPIGITARELLGLGTGAHPPERPHDTIARNVEACAAVDDATRVGHDLRIRRDDEAKEIARNDRRS